MSLKKYPACDEAHASDFQYVCLKEKRVFCMKCWFKCQHFRYCQSSRCGQYTKIAHLALNRAYQYKNAQILQSMTLNNQSYQSLRVRYLQLNFQITEIIKEFVQQKMPLFLWSMTNQLLLEKVGSQVPNLNKFDSVCTDMIKIIKSSDASCRQEHLQSAIGAYFDINHHIEGQLYLLRNGSGFKNNINKEQQAAQVMEKIKSQLTSTISNIKKGIRKTIDEELDKTTTQIDPGCKYKGVAFIKSSIIGENYRKREQYPYINILSQAYGKITNQQNDLYNGFHLSLPELEINPQQLLQVSKCIIKQRLFSIYEGIQTIKSAFPYKFAYPISTTLSTDQKYEQLVLDIQKSILDSSQKSNPFLNSLNIVVMGRQLIVIRFFNNPRFCYTRKIYNYKKQRQGYYETIINKFGLTQIPIRTTSNASNVSFSEQLTQKQLVYCHFQTACQFIFHSQNDDLVFQGQRLMANKGAENFSLLIDRWRNTAELQLNFDRPLTEMLRYFI